MKNEKAIMFSFIIEANDEGYLASVPGIQGAFAEGDTVEEALFNCVDVLKMIMEYKKERGEKIGINSILMNKNTKMTISFPVGLNQHV
jgi:predicted RNase H-like HicB family nuclease